MTLSESFDSIANRRVVLFGGKGGVGKSTIAALAALHFAKSRKVVLFTTDPASNVLDLFPTEQRPSNLTIEALDANALYRSFLDKNLDDLLEIGDRGTYLDREELRHFFELSLPGIDELMAWLRIGEIAEQNADAIVVVDTAPTGHTLRMLDASEHIRRFVGALDTLAEKHRGMVRQFTRRNMRDTIDDFIEHFDMEGRRQREMLTSAETAAFIPVLLSEPWIVAQTVRLAAEVREDGIDIPFAILNRTATRCDCERCRSSGERDAAARHDLAPLSVVDAPRSCRPLDSVEALERFGRGDPAGPISADSFLSTTPAVCDVSRLKLLFVAGKGGVGKTTSAVSIALQLARGNPEKLYSIISVDPAHTLRDVFADEGPPRNVAVELVETRSEWRRFRERLGEEIESAVQALSPSGMSVAYDIEAMQQLIDVGPPGADEIFAISRLADLIADDAQQTIVIDTAPTGHFLRLLELPQIAGEWVREFMRLLLRYREIVPSGSLGEELVRASRALKSVEQILHSGRSGVLVVTRPERIVVAETKRLLDELQRRAIAICSVIANYVTPATGCSCDQTARSYETGALAALGHELVIVERREAPVIGHDDLATLVPLRDGRPG